VRFIAETFSRDFSLCASYMLVRHLSPQGFPASGMVIAVYRPEIRSRIAGKDRRRDACARVPGSVARRSERMEIVV
jgi:hypothetical protein